VHSHIHILTGAFPVSLFNENLVVNKETNMVEHGNITPSSCQVKFLGICVPYSNYGNAKNKANFSTVQRGDDVF